MELLVVISIIIVLAGLILGTTGYVQKKGARSRAEAEIAALSAACESYKADNGVYPTDTATNALDPTSSGDPNSNGYKLSSLYLFTELSGLDASQSSTGKKSFFSFKPQMLGGTRDASGNVITVAYIRDPFGNSYGYSTSKATNPTGNGYNPTFDLWSTAGTTTTNAADVAQWIKNW
jgi:type II secretory pathway pseudopilin PulG